MSKKTSFALWLLLALVAGGQAAFLALSGRFTAPRYEGRIFATTGVMHESEDLHKLNEAAHYFGYTLIGWTKFPSFNGRAKAAASLPEDAVVGAYLQERQNIIFTVGSREPLRQEQLEGVRAFFQSEIDAYNALSQTRFVLSNSDYEVADVSKSYALGAIAVLLASGVLWLGILFVKREFFGKRA